MLRGRMNEQMDEQTYGQKTLASKVATMQNDLLKVDQAC